MTGKEKTSRRSMAAIPKKKVISRKVAEEVKPSSNNTGDSATSEQSHQTNEPHTAIDGTKNRGSQTQVEGPI
jgi:hypothetical protein